MKKVFYYLFGLFLIVISCSPKEKDIFADIENVDVRPYTLTDSTTVGDLFVYGLWGQVKDVKQSVYLEDEFKYGGEVSFSPKGRVTLPSEFRKSTTRDKNTEKFTLTTYEEGYKYVEVIERKYDSNGLLLSVRHAIPGDCTVKLTYVYSPYPTKKLTAISEEIEDIENHNRDIKYALGIYPDVREEGYYATLSFPTINNKKFKINSTDDKGNWTNVSFLSEEGKKYVITREISYYTANSSNNNSTTVRSKSASENEDLPFRNVNDVWSSLMRYSFSGTSKGETMTLSFKPDGMYANGRQLTGAIEVISFDEVNANLRCTSPFDGAVFQIQYVNGILVKILNSGEVYLADR